MAKTKRWKAAGITPACAGKSLLPSENVLQVEDHPRVCGEKFLSLCSHSLGW